MTWRQASFYPLKKISFVVLCLILLFSQIPVVQALSTEDIESIRNNTPFFDADDTVCGSSSSAADVSAPDGTDTPKWVTTLQAPYNLEDFVVEVLNDIAGKEGVPTTDTLTEQHVLALVAFAYGEGGNLTNHDIYNPWNTGYTGPDLQPVGGHRDDGVQSYASFNDGVEATARVMTGTGGSSGYQSRLGTILKDPTSTAQQFMKTLTYFQNYKGNKEWATASLPPNQNSYYEGRLEKIQFTESHYTDIASSVIGLPGDSYNNNQHTNKPLRYSFSDDTSVVTASPGSGDNASESANDCTTSVGAVQGNIAQTAINLAWDDTPKPKPANWDSHGDAASCYNYAQKISVANPAPTSCYHGFQQLGESVNINGGSHSVAPSLYTKPSYQTDFAKYDSGAPDDGYTDCGVFVATVLHATGVAKDWPDSSTSTQLQWAKDHPDKYTVIPSFTSTADLQVGDVLVADGHTYIYVGPQPDGYSVAEASQDNHSPEIDSLPYPSQNNGAEVFSVVRIKQ